MAIPNPCNTQLCQTVAASAAETWYTTTQKVGKTHYYTQKCPFAAHFYIIFLIINNPLMSLYTSLVMCLQSEGREENYLHTVTCEFDAFK